MAPNHFQVLISNVKAETDSLEEVRKMEILMIYLIAAMVMMSAVKVNSTNSNSSSTNIP